MSCVKNFLSPTKSAFQYTASEFWRIIASNKKTTIGEHTEKENYNQASIRENEEISYDGRNWIGVTCSVFKGSCHAMDFNSKSYGF